MDSIVDVALWQRGIQNGDDQELGPVCYLFEASVSAFSALLHILAADSSQFESESYQRLRNEFRKFYMWNEGFSTRTGDLDHILASSKNLKGTVLGLMVQWVKAVSKIPEVKSEYNWSSAFTEVTELQMRAHKVDQIAKATMLDLKSQCSVFDNVDAGDESDSGSDVESSPSDFTFEDIVEDLGIYMDSLADLSSSLDHPAKDNILIEDLNTSLVEEFVNVPEPARPFVFIIRDRFPSLETGIVKRLGEANWQRRERLRMKFESAPGMDETSSTEDGSSSLDDIIVDPRRNIVKDQQTVVSTIRTSISLTRTVQSTAIASDFSDPSLFDSMSISVPRARRVRPPESDTSFATSMAEGLDQGQRRIPNLPEQHEYGSPFQCQICGDVQTGIRNRGDWKKHVYRDLEPYICLFPGCEMGLRTFQSRREWRSHEFQVHRVNIEWRCNLCKRTIETQEVLREHMIAVHENEITTSQVEEVISTSKRLVPCTVATQLCPFCLTAPSETQAGFANHVGKHQQEIALAALPWLGDTSDDEKTENSESSDNVNDDDDPKTISSACMFCGETDRAMLRNQTVCLACRRSLSLSNFGILLVDIHQEPDSMELLMTAVLAAASSGMQELLPGCPFNNITTIPTLLNKVPSMASFAKIENLREYILTLGQEIEKLLIWVCTGYRGHLISAPEPMRVPGMPSGTHQFVLASATPELENTFASHVNQISPRSPRIVFHGTSVDHLFAILHQGIQNMSGTPQQRHGASINGIYVTDEPSQSLASPNTTINAAWKSTRFLGLRVLLGCELADPSARGSGGVIVVTNPATLMLRYVFLLPENSIAPLAKLVVPTMARTCNTLRSSGGHTVESTSTISIRESRFDIANLDIDSDYLSALPEDLREEAILQSLIRQKSKAAASGPALSGVHQRFLNTLSKNVVEELSQQERNGQPQHDDATINQNAAGFPEGPMFTDGEEKRVTSEHRDEDLAKPQQQTSPQHHNGKYATSPAQKNAFLHFHNPKYLELLNTLTELQALNVESNFDLPQIIVCGSQSSGKSSVLEAITEIPFPRSENTCTRFVTKVTLRPHPRELVEVKIEQADPAGSRNSVPRFPPITDLGNLASELQEQFKKAADAILGNQQQTKFSRDILSITISGPDRPILQILDLPGLIWHDASDKGKLKLVRDIVESEMKKQHSTILAVVAANIDFEIQGVLSLCEEYDSKGERTVGIITQPDKAEKQQAETCVAIAQGLRKDEVRIQHGWHVLRNRNSEELKNNTTIEARNAAEERFLREEPWARLGPENLGVATLRIRLSKILLDTASREFPKLAAVTKAKLEELATQRKHLGGDNMTEEERRHIFYDAARNLKDMTSSCVAGNYGYDTSHLDPYHPIYLRSRIVDQNELFRDRIMTEGHREDELPGTFSPQHINDFFWKQSKPWNQIAEEHIRKIFEHCELYFKHATLMAFAPDPLRSKKLTFSNHQVVAERVFKLICSKLEGMKEDAKRELRQIEIDRRHTQLNFLPQYLAEYRQQRNDKDSKRPMPELNPNTKAEGQHRHTQGDWTEEKAEDFLKAAWLQYKFMRDCYIANILTQVVERHFIRGLSELTPDVRLLENTMFCELVEEDKDLEQKREALKRKSEVLEKCLDILEQHRWI